MSQPSRGSPATPELRSDPERLDAAGRAEAALSPGELGRLPGADGSPEVRTLRTAARATRSQNEDPLTLEVP